MSRDSIDNLLQRGYRYALSLAHDPTAAEDLLHDAWLAIHRRQRRPSLHAGYLFAAIRNRFIDGRRRETRFPLHSLDSTPIQGVSDAFFEPGTVDAMAIDEALASLRDDERELVFLTAVEGYTVREAAELTGRPLGTVSSLVQRAKRKLRAALAQPERRAAP